MDAPTAALYFQLGVNFVVSPLLNEAIAPVVNRRKIGWSRGCRSVREISKAESLGVDPSEVNLSDWFKAGVTCVGMGSKLLSSEIIKNKDFNKLEQDVRNAITIIKNFRQLYPVSV